MRYYIPHSFVAALVAGTLIFASPFVSAQSRDRRAQHEYTTRSEERAETRTATLLRVVDGDTVEVQMSGRKTTIRLIGIDTPETQANEHAYRSARRRQVAIGRELADGKRAKEFAKQLLTIGSTVRIEFDREREDRYGRTLGYLFLPDGRLFNKAIIQSGNAALYRATRNRKYHDELEVAEKSG